MFYCNVSGCVGYAAIMQLSQGNILIKFQSKFNVTIPGTYSVIFTAFDFIDM